MEPTTLGAVLLAAVTMTGSPADTVPLYDNLGSHHHEITTSSPLAQQYFDQGLRLTYAFNHAEAIASFEQAARLDPDCAMCWWGIAYAHGPNINAPMDSAAGEEAYRAAREALARAQAVTERERSYIWAVAARYASPPPVERAALDSAYAAAMDEVATRWPDDLDAAAIAAEAAMDLRPWNYWTAAGEPQPGTTRILERLEGILARNPNHPGACHFYIHAVEAVAPEKAVACAERLADLMPGAGHIVHMPAHIYIRVGRYQDAIDANVHAVHMDQTFIGDRGPAGIYPGFYYPHNHHFLAFASRFAGRSATAIEAAHAASANMDTGLAAAVPEAASLLPYPHLTLVTFGRWEDVLAEPVGYEDVPLAAAQAHYARGIAFAATGRFAEAEAELVRVRAAEGAVSEGWPRTVVQIADHALQGEIAVRRGDLDPGIGHLRAAARLEDSLGYTEPPYWNWPVRHALGAALLRAGRAAEAEAVYREDLARFPENGWSLFGLAESLEAQGKEADAREARERFARAWTGADIEIAGSSF